jgi:hypothetical protein
MDLKIDNHQEEGMTLSLVNIASFFGNIVFYSKDDLYQTQVEEDLVLFIAKEFVFVFC